MAMIKTIEERTSKSPFSEDEMARQFTKLHGATWKYVASWGYWLVWTGKRWQLENTLRAIDLARDVCHEAAGRCTERRLRRTINRLATVQAVERLARSDRVHAMTPDVWDRDKMALNTHGGLIDLVTGANDPHRPESLNMKIAGAAPQGACPLWREFLTVVTGGDDELAGYLQRVAGYCLTGETREQVAFFFFGTGANGKSVLVDILAKCLGDYAVTASPEMLVNTGGQSHPTELARLQNARLVVISESEEGRRWAESKLKWLTGGDRLAARFMRKDFFEFTPQFKLLIVGNHKPAITNLDAAMRRRLQIVPFYVTIPAEERDTKLVEKLDAERDGILAWAIEGCRHWQQLGLSPPPAVQSATSEYLESEDHIANWLDDTCAMIPGARTRSSDLFESWIAWARASGNVTGSERALVQALSDRGYRRYRSRSSRGFEGLTLRQQGVSGVTHVTGPTIGAHSASTSIQDEICHPSHASPTVPRKDGE